MAAPVFADILRFALTADGVVPSGTARPDFVLTGPSPLTRPRAGRPGRRRAGGTGRGRGGRSCAGRLGPRDRDRRRVGAPARGQPLRCRWPRWPICVGPRSPTAPAACRVLHAASPWPPTRCGPGDLYAALPGARTHGAGYAADAAAARRGRRPHRPDRRATRPPPTGLPVCVVDDPRAVLGAVADRVYGEPSARAHRHRHHRHQRQDDDRVPRRGRAARRRARAPA